MKCDRGLSETVSVILIIGMVLILAVVIAAFVLGVNIIPQNPAYIAVDIQKVPVSGTEAISIFHRAGDTASLKNITDLHQYVLSFYVDTTSGSYRVQPPSGVDIFSPGTTLFVYNTSTGIYKITNNSADLVSAPPPISLTSVRLIDEKSHQLIAQWKNSTGFSSGGTSVLPTVTGISPVTGSTLGGTVVTITGTNLLGAASGGANGVTFGGAAATGVSVVSGTSITATTSAHTAGAVNVVVTTPNGTVTGTTGAFTYVDPPTFVSIAPPTGPTGGGTVVTITGTNLFGAAAGGVNGVTFDGIVATSFSVDSGTSITATTPVHATAGAVNVVVTTPNGTATGSGAYTYIAPPLFASAATNAAGNVINITFNKAMANPAGKQAEFKYQINGGSDQTFSAAALNTDTTKIDLTMSGTAIAYGDVVTISYTAGTVTAADTGVLASFAGQSVANNKAAPPLFASAATNAAGNAINITFNKAMANPAGKQAEFKYKINGGSDQTFSAAALNADPTKIDLTTSGTAIAGGNVVTVSYTAGTVTAADTGVLAGFVGQPVTNNMPAPPTFSSAATNAAGNTITIIFNKAMANPAGKQAEFKYKIDGGSDQAFSAAALNAGNIVLTTSGTAIAYGNTVTVSYTAGTVTSADTGVLASFVGQPVTNNKPAPIIQTFTATPPGGTWAKPAGVTSVQYCVVAGGGGGGGLGGGGGAGGFLTGTVTFPSAASNQAVTIGTGGAGSTGRATSGLNSVFGTTTVITATGGGGGGGSGTGSTDDGRNGGSGGGAARSTGTIGSGTGVQGNNGGLGLSLSGPTRYFGGGGGGATSGAAGIGGAASGTTAGSGGTGSLCPINGATYAGGGGGGATSGTAGIGGAGGGGNGAVGTNVGSAGAVNTGGGGGGSGSTSRSGGTGGSGFVIIKY